MKTQRCTQCGSVAHRTPENSTETSVPSCSKDLASQDHLRFFKSRDYPFSTINATIPTRRPDAPKQEDLFGNSQSEAMQIGGETSTTGNTRTLELSVCWLQQEHNARTDPTAGIFIVFGPREAARYYQLLSTCNLPICAGTLANTQCMRYPKGDPSPNMGNTRTRTATHNRQEQEPGQCHTLPTLNQNRTLAELAAEHGNVLNQHRCSTPIQDPDPVMCVPETPPRGVDNKMTTQEPMPRPSANCKAKAN